MRWELQVLKSQIPPYRFYFQPHWLLFSRLKKLLAPKDPQKPHTDDQLAQQADPEPRLGQSLRTHQPEIGKNIPGPQFIWRRRPRRDRHRTANHLTGTQCGRDVKPRKRLQEDHAESDTLQGVEDAEPEPERAGEEGAKEEGGRMAGGQVDGQVERDAGGGP